MFLKDRPRFPDADFAKKVSDIYCIYSNRISTIRFGTMRWNMVYNHCLSIWYYVFEIQKIEWTSHKGFLTKIYDMITLINIPFSSATLSLNFKIFEFLKRGSVWTFLFWKKISLTDFFCRICNLLTDDELCAQTNEAEDSTIKWF